MPEDHAFGARGLLRAARVATLATQHGGQPFASLVTPAAAPDGSVLLLLSSLAAHTRHLDADPRCALLVCGPPTSANPQTAPRLTLTGRASPDGEKLLRRHWVDRHPYAAAYADFTDFSVWRVVAEAGHYVGGFAQAHSLAGLDLRSPPDAAHAISLAEPHILAHCNADHADAMDRLAHAAGRTGHWRMLGVDTDGVDLVQDDAVVRIGFDRSVADGTGVRAALVRLLQRATV